MNINLENSEIPTCVSNRELVTCAIGILIYTGQEQSSKTLVLNGIIENGGENG